MNAIQNIAKTLWIILFFLGLKTTYAYQKTTQTCDVCDVSMASAAFIFSTLNNNDCAYNLSLNVPIDDCIDDLFIDWGDGSTEFASVEDFDVSHTYAMDGSYLLSISYVDNFGTLDQVICDPFEFGPIEVDSNCGACPNPCDIDAFFEYGRIGGDPCRYRFEGDNLLNDCDPDTYTWTWMVNGSAVFGSSTPNFMYDFSGIAGFPEIKLTIVYFDGERTCEDSYAVSFQVSCPSKSTNSSILYPNPADTSFKIIFTGDLSAKKISIKDLFGKIVKQDVSTGTDVNVSSLLKGIYIVEILLEDGSTVTEKLLIE